VGGARLLVNPTAGRGRGARARALWESIRPPGEAEIVSTRSPEHLTEEARRAVADGVERLIVVGGDGTIHRVLEPLSGRDTALGIVPVGTGNDLARALGLIGSTVDCLGRALHAPIHRIDLGEIDGRPFAGVAGIGYVDAVADRVRRGRGKWLGPLAYAAAALAELTTFVPQPVTVEHDAGRIDGPMMLVLWANSTRFGGGMRVDDGLLDIVSLRACSRFELARALPSVFRGRHVDHPKVEIVRTARSAVRVEVPSTFWADGEPVLRAGSGTVRISVRQRALAIIR
jgi:diacylglycerol kinase (ATP)